MARRRTDHVDLIIENRSAAPATGAVWPDGAHSQIYTNPDGPDAYVELELLGPAAGSRTRAERVAHLPLRAASPGSAPAAATGEGTPLPRVVGYGQVGNCAVVAAKVWESGKFCKLMLVETVARFTSVRKK